MRKKFLLFAVLYSGFVNAQTNYALSFNGTSDYVDLGTSASSNIRTIEFWFKPNTNITSASTFDAYSLVVRDDATQYHEYAFQLLGTNASSGDIGRLSFGMRDNGNNHQVVSNSNSWNAGTWYHACATLDPISGLKLYVNGVLQTQDDPAGTMPIPSSAENTVLGKWGLLSIRYFPGRIDELCFWNRALSQSEIQQRMCYWLNPANETGLIGYWKMNEGSGTTINDGTTSSNNGTMFGAAFVLDSNCFSGTLGINEIATQNDISIFPNPFSYQTTLQPDKPFENATLILYNLFGQPVEEIRNISGGSFQLSRNKLSNGVYFVQVMQANKIILNKRLIIAD